MYQRLPPPRPPPAIQAGPYRCSWTSYGVRLNPETHDATGVTALAVAHFSIPRSGALLSSRRHSTYPIKGPQVVGGDNVPTLQAWNEIP